MEQCFLCQEIADVQCKGKTTDVNRDSIFKDKTKFDSALSRTVIRQGKMKITNFDSALSRTAFSLSQRSPDSSFLYSALSWTAMMQGKMQITKFPQCCPGQRSACLTAVQDSAEARTNVNDFENAQKLAKSVWNK